MLFKKWRSKESPLVNPAKEEIIVKYDEGEVRLKVRPITRAMRKEALERAVMAYREAHPNSEKSIFLPSVFERELALRCIAEWSLPTPVSIGWDLLPVDSDLGDKIVEAIGIADAINPYSEGNKEIADAKNS